MGYTYVGQPNGAVLRNGTGETGSPSPHASGSSDCTLPYASEQKRGTIYQCECGKRWVTRYGYWSRRLLPWPKPPRDDRNPVKNELKELKKIEKSLRG